MHELFYNSSYSTDGFSQSQRKTISIYKTAHTFLFLNSEMNFTTS